MVRRAVESPWERIRALRGRCETPLGMALRGRFLVGGRPLSRDLVRRFVQSAADSGIDVFRIHDPLNDLDNLQEAAEAVLAAEKELAIGLVHSPGTRRRDRPPRGAGGAPSGPRRHEGARSTIPPARSILRAPVTSSWLCAREAGFLSACTARVLRAWHSPRPWRPPGAEPSSSRVPSTRSRSLFTACQRKLRRDRSRRSGSRREWTSSKLWQACELVDSALGEEPVAPLSPRVAVRAAEHAPPGRPRGGARPEPASPGLRRPARRGSRRDAEGPRARSAALRWPRRSARSSASRHYSTSSRPNAGPSSSTRSATS